MSRLTPGRPPQATGGGVSPLQERPPGNQHDLPAHPRYVPGRSAPAGTRRPPPGPGRRHHGHPGGLHLARGRRPLPRTPRWPRARDRLGPEGDPHPGPERDLRGGPQAGLSPRSDPSRAEVLTRERAVALEIDGAPAEIDDLKRVFRERTGYEISIAFKERRPAPPGQGLI